MEYKENRFQFKQIKTKITLEIEKYINKFIYERFFFYAYFFFICLLYKLINLVVMLKNASLVPFVSSSSVEFKSGALFSSTEVATLVFPVK
jgi:hypothetical protein